MPRTRRYQAALAQCAPVAQLDRASDYESEGRTFESFRARQFLQGNHYIAERARRLIPEL
jgi:hypothetical protein